MDFSHSETRCLRNPIGGTRPIRALLFDLDGTLYVQSWLRALMALEMATLPLTAPLAAPKRLRALRAYRAAQESLRAAPRSRIAAAQLAIAAEASGLPVAEVERVVQNWMSERPLKYLQFCRSTGLDDVLTLAGSAGAPVGILSDYPALPKLRAMGLEGRFSPVLCASDPDIDVFKPHPRGFRRACQHWSLEPSEVLFVGDRADVDAVGAAAAGMPCAIISTRQSAGAAGAHVVFRSLEALRRVIDPR